MVQTAALIGTQAGHLRDQVARFVLDLRSAGSSNTPPRPAVDESDYQYSQRRRALAS